MHDDWDARPQEASRSTPGQPLLNSSRNPGRSLRPRAGHRLVWRAGLFGQLSRRAILLALVCAWAVCMPHMTRGQQELAEPNLGEAAPLEPAKPAAPPEAAKNKAPAPALPPDADLIAEDDAGPAESSASGPVAGKDYLIPTDPLELFLAGGIAMWPLLVASLISLWFVLERMVVLRRRRVIPRAFVDRFLQHLEQGKLNAETALRLCEENKSPIAEVFAHGVRKWGKTSVEVEQAIIDGGERQIAQLRTHLRIIHGVYTVSPLLGLMGTVVGMIMSFNQLALGGDADRMQRLASGVGVALIATATGLFVAIPSFIFYMYLAGRVDSLVIEMDTLAQKVVNFISSEGLASRARSSTAKANPTLSPAASGMPAGKPKAVGT